MTLYHGTRRYVTKGALLLPPALHGRGQANPLEDYDDAQHWVFVSPERAVAEHFARRAEGRGRPKVLTVTPLDPVEPDWATFGGEDGWAFRCRSAVVDAVEVLPER